MGLWDSLTNAFTGDAAAKAAEQQRNYLSGVQTQGTGAIQTGLANATDYLNQGTQNATGAIRGGLTGATGTIQGGQTGSLAALAQGYAGSTAPVNNAYDAANSYVTGGAGAANGYYDKAGDAYDPLSALAAKYGGATSTALGALGVGTPEQTAAARAAFTTTPGYNFNLDQGLEALIGAAMPAGCWTLGTPIVMLRPSVPALPATNIIPG
jgi:hypothetical protein